MPNDDKPKSGAVDKYQLAMYLVNLHTLLEAQSKGASLPSTTLSNEYNENWQLLKTTINKENEYDARPSNDQRRA